MKSVVNNFWSGDLLCHEVYSVVCCTNPKYTRFVVQYFDNIYKGLHLIYVEIVIFEFNYLKDSTTKNDFETKWK